MNWDYWADPNVPKGMLVSVHGEMRGEISHAPLNYSHYAMMFVILIKIDHQRASATPELSTYPT